MIDVFWQLVHHGELPMKIFEIEEQHNRRNADDFVSLTAVNENGSGITAS